MAEIVEYGKKAAPGEENDCFILDSPLQILLQLTLNVFTRAAFEAWSSFQTLAQGQSLEADYTFYDIGVVSAGFSYSFPSVLAYVLQNIQRVFAGPITERWVPKE